MSSNSLSSSKIYTLLFHEKLGACVKLKYSQINDSPYINDQFKVIDSVWSISSNIRCDANMLPINKQFIEWGCNLIPRLLADNALFEAAERIVVYVTLLHSTLSPHSIGLQSLFNKETLILLLSQFENTVDTTQKRYINLLQKICKFCCKEFADESLLCTVLGIVSELMKNIKFTNVLEDLITYSRTALSMHVENLDSRKVDSESVINSCLKVIEVPVRSERHAVGRIHLWWQLLCWMKRETFVSMIDRCLLPFLSNLFGKYLSFEEAKCFQYGLIEYNCFTNPNSMGPLCHHAMIQLLRSINRKQLRCSNVAIKLCLQWSFGIKPISDDVSTFDMLSIDFVMDRTTIQSHIQSLMFAFSAWCQFSKMVDASVTFLLLNDVFSCFYKRLVAETEVATIAMRPLTLSSSLLPIITIMCREKQRLEATFKNRPLNVVFEENAACVATIAKCLQESEESNNVVCNSGEGWRKALLKLLVDCVSKISQVCRTPSVNSHSICESSCYNFLESCKYVIDRLWPGVGARTTVDQRTVCEELRQVMAHWRVDATVVNVHSWNGYRTNLKLWTLIATKVVAYIARDDYTFDNFKDIDHLASLVAAPVSFLRRINRYSLLKEDAEYVRDVSNRLVTTLARKVHVMPGTSGDEWCAALSQLLVSFFSEAKLSHDQILSLNITSHIVHILVDSCPTTYIGTDNYKDSAVWHCATVLAAVLKSFKWEHVRLSLDIGVVFNQLFSSEEQVADIRIERDFCPRDDPDFSLGLVMTACNNLLDKISDNGVLICLILKHVLPVIAKLYKEMFTFEDFSYKVPEWKKKVLLHPDKPKVEELLVSLLKKIKIYCHKTDIFSVAEPIYEVLFSYHYNVISRPTMLVAIELWNDVIVNSIVKYDNVLATDFYKNLKLMKSGFKAFKVPSVKLKIPDQKNLMNQSHKFTKKGRFNCFSLGWLPSDNPGALDNVIDEILGWNQANGVQVTAMANGTNTTNGGFPKKESRKSHKTIDEGCVKRRKICHEEEISNITKEDSKMEVFPQKHYQSIEEEPSSGKISSDIGIVLGRQSMHKLIMEKYPKFLRPISSRRRNAQAICGSVKGRWSRCSAVKPKGKLTTKISRQNVSVTTPDERTIKSEFRRDIGDKIDEVLREIIDRGRDNMSVVSKSDQVMPRFDEECSLLMNNDRAGVVEIICKVEKDVSGLDMDTCLVKSEDESEYNFQSEEEESSSYSDDSYSSGKSVKKVEKPKQSTNIDDLIDEVLRGFGERVEGVDNTRSPESDKIHQVIPPSLPSKGSDKIDGDPPGGSQTKSNSTSVDSRDCLKPSISIKKENSGGPSKSIVGIDNGHPKSMRKSLLAPQKTVSKLSSNISLKSGGKDHQAEKVIKDEHISDEKALQELNSSAKDVNAVAKQDMGELIDDLLRGFIERNNSDCPESTRKCLEDSKKTTSKLSSKQSPKSGGREQMAKRLSQDDHLSSEGDLEGCVVEGVKASMTTNSVGRNVPRIHDSDEDQPTLSTIDTASVRCVPVTVLLTKLSADIIGDFCKYGVAGVSGGRCEGGVE